MAARRNTRSSRHAPPSWAASHQADENVSGDPVLDPPLPNLIGWVSDLNMAAFLRFAGPRGRRHPAATPRPRRHEDRLRTRQPVRKRRIFHANPRAIGPQSRGIATAASSRRSSAKGQSRLEGFNERIIVLYARGMTTRDIRAHLREMYDVEGLQT